MASLNLHSPPTPPTSDTGAPSLSASRADHGKGKTKTVSARRKSLTPLLYGDEPTSNIRSMAKTNNKSVVQEHRPRMKTKVKVRSPLVLLFR
jgi:hypothetical protein